MNTSKTYNLGAIILMNLIQKLFGSRQSLFVITTIALVVWLLCFSLFQDGMFIDGIQYAAIARNLARGVGTFWNPVLASNSVAGLNSFHEHPPLVFFIQSFFFKVFGMNNIYPERIYCLFTFLATALFMVLIWRQLFAGQRSNGLWWLPILLWIIMPIVFWAYTNDIQEITMGVFTTAAVYFFLRATRSVSIFRSIPFYIGVASVLLAAFCKGVPGLFPLAFFVLYWFSLKKISFTKAVVLTLVAIVIIAIVTALILQNPAAYASLHIWFVDRMLKRISNDPTENSHFYILWGLFTEQLPSLILVALSFIVLRIRKAKNEFDEGHVRLFILLGLAASLPLTLTLVQRNFYFIPALPMFAIAWALCMEKGINNVLDYLEKLSRLKTRLTVFVFLILIVGIAATIVQSGKIKRDKEMLQDVYTIEKIIPKNSFVAVTSNVMWMDWSFRCYMMRYNEISFTDKDTCNYFIALKTEGSPTKNIDTVLNRITLYRRN